LSRPNDGSFRPASEAFQMTSDYTAQLAAKLEMAVMRRPMVM
jgi:hypothetical protein